MSGLFSVTRVVSHELLVLLAAVWLALSDFRLHNALYSNYLRRNQSEGHVWSSYVDTMLFKLVQNPQVPSTVYSSLIQRMSAGQTHYVQNFRDTMLNKMKCLPYGEYLFTEPIGELLSSFNSGHILRQVTKQLGMCANLEAWYWFELHKELSLNLTFYILYFSGQSNGHLEVYSSQQKKLLNWSDNSFKVSWKGQSKMLSSCFKVMSHHTPWFLMPLHLNGLLSSFNMFTPHNINLLTLSAHKHSVYHVHMFFSIIKIQTLVNIFPVSLGPSIKFIFSLLAKFLLWVFYIRVKETCFLLLNIDSEEVWVFDGPGRFAPELTSSNSLFTTSSFQCVVQERIADFSERFDLDYSSALGEVHSHISVIELPLSVKLPNQNCEKGVCLYQVHTHENWKLNLSFSMFVHSISKSRNIEASCLYSGLIFTEKFDFELDEKHPICDSMSAAKHFYSSGPEASVVMYWYNSYANLNVNIILWKHNCDVVSLNYCQLKEYCPQSRFPDSDPFILNRNKCGLYLNVLSEKLNSSVKFSLGNKNKIELLLPETICSVITFVRQNFNQTKVVENYFEMDSNSVGLSIRTSKVRNFSQEFRVNAFLQMRSHMFHATEHVAVNAGDKYCPCLNPMSKDIRGTFRQKAQKLGELMIAMELHVPVPGSNRTEDQLPEKKINCIG